MLISPLLQQKSPSTVYTGQIGCGPPDCSMKLSNSVPRTISASGVGKKEEAGSTC